MTTPDPINKLRDKTIAKLRTIIPSAWGTLVGVIVTWAVTHGWVTQDVAYQYQGVIVTATGGVVVTITITITYSVARWIEEQQGPVARFIAKMLLCVLAPPAYTTPSPAAVLPPGVEADPTAGPAHTGVMDVEKPKGITKPPA